MQHFQPVKGANTLGNLLDDAADGFQVGARIVDHPLRQRLAFDVFTHAVQVAAFARLQAWLGDVCTIDASCHPVLREETFQVLHIPLQVHRGRFDDDRCVAVIIGGEVDMAAAAGVDFSHDGVAVEFGSRLKDGREGQFGQLLQEFVGSLQRQRLDTQDLHSEVVIAALSQRLGDDGPCGCVQIIRIVSDGADHRRRADVLVHAVGGEDKGVAHVDRFGAIVQIQLRVNAQRSAQIALVFRDPHAVVIGQLLERSALNAVDA